MRADLTQIVRNNTREDRTFAMVDRSTPVWLMKLASRPNLFTSEIPYVPVPLEEIDEYAKSDDFTEDCVKTIETIGILRPLNQRRALLVSTPGSAKSKLRLAIDHLDSDYLYPEGSKGESTMLRDAWRAVRVYGLLESRNKKIVLGVEIYDRVNDVESAVKVLKLLARLAHRRISMHIHDPESCPPLKHYAETQGRAEGEAVEKKRPSTVDPPSDQVGCLLAESQRK